MRTFCKIYILLIILLVNIYSCRKDGRTPILNLKGKCLISNDTTQALGNDGYSNYEFESNTNRLTVSKKVVGNGVLMLYSEIYYLSAGQPENTITYTSANEFYETKFYYRNNSLLPYKSELFLTNKLNSPVAKNVWGFNFSYDAKGRLNEVVFATPKNGDQEYTLHISYNDKDNVTRLEYEITSGPPSRNTVITVQAFDDKPNPYCTIPYWEFLVLNASWDNYDPEPIITALSKNNPLDYSIGKFKREMSYTYNQYGFPVRRVNTNRTGSGQYSFAEAFNYRCN